MSEESDAIEAWERQTGLFSGYGGRQRCSECKQYVPFKRQVNPRDYPHKAQPVCLKCEAQLERRDSF